MAGITEKLTLDDLSTIARVENNSPTLSSVRKDLYPAMMELYNSLVRDCDRLAAENPDSVMFDGINERRRKVQSRMKAITEKRLKKIAELALRNAIGANNPVEILTPEEKEYYDTVVEATKRHWNLLSKKKGTIPDITKVAAPADPEPVKEVPVKKEEPRPEPRVSTATIEIPTEEYSEVKAEPVPEPETEIAEEVSVIEGPVTVEEPPAEEAPAADDEELRELIKVDPVPEPEPAELDFNEDFVIIRVTGDIPPFSGPDRDYNLVKEDVVRMPTMMAAALVNRGLAVIIPTP